jgi:cell wall-associated NlpC family hydrolase
MRCAVDVAALCAEPRDVSEQVSQVLRGEPLEELESRPGWVRVLTAYDYPGWLRSEQLEEGPGELPADAAGSPVEVARLYLGAPYEWGGMTERGIDCSGLVHMAYRRLGRLVPRDAHQQEAAGADVPVPAPGDLVAYGDPVDHIAFWLGGDQILHATGRPGIRRVLEEAEPAELRARRRRFLRL